MKENLISSATQAEQINQVLSVDLIALFKYLLQKNYKRPVSHILMQRKSNNWNEQPKLLYAQLTDICLSHLLL